MSGGGFEVDPEALDGAAGKIRTAVADGTLELQCFAWGTGYGHDALSAAVLTFMTDVDQGVEQVAAKAEALAVSLVEQAEDYRTVDTCVQGQLTNPFLAPAPFAPAQPFAPVSPFAGGSPAFPAAPSAGPVFGPAGGTW